MEKKQYSVHARLGLGHWWHYGTKMFFQRLIKKSLSNGAYILDAGCGVGDMIALLNGEYHVIGIDCSNDAVRYCIEKNIKNIVMGDISSLPFENESYNGVLSLDVLYHKWISGDFQALREIYRVTKPGGTAFIQLPAYEWLRSSHDEWAFSCRRYTAGRLAYLLKSAGFSQIKVSYRVSLVFPLVVVWRYFFKSKNSDMREVNPIINSILRMIIKFENLISQYVSFPFGLSVIGIAKK